MCMLTLMATGKKARRNVLLDPSDDAALIEFCRKTHRDPPETIRAIVRLFFANGFEVASDRLNAGLWENAQKSPQNADIPGSTPAERAEYIVSGKRSGDSQNARKPA